MCDLISGAASLLPGWACCRCRGYQGLWRTECRFACGTRCGRVDDLLKEAEARGEFRTCPGCGAGYRPEHLAGGERGILSLGASALTGVADGMPGPPLSPVPVGKCASCGAWDRKLAATVGKES